MCYFSFALTGYFTNQDIIMKNIVSIFSVLLCLSSFAQNKSQYAIISGNIRNTQEKSIIISEYDHSFEKELAIDAAGNFSDTLFINSAGYYFFKVGKSFTSIFLKNGYNLNIITDADEFYKSFQFKGTGADVNDFTRARSNLKGKMVGDAKEFFVTPVPNFIKKVEDLRDSLQLLLDQSALSAEDKRIQKIIIQYDYLLTYNNYRKFYQYHTKTEPVLPADYLNPVKTMNMDDEEAFQYSNEYRLLIIENYLYAQKELLKKDSTFSMIDYVESNIKGLKSEKIKNRLVSMLFRYIKPENKKIEEDYKKIMSLLTDEYLKKDLVRRYAVAKSTDKGMVSADFNYENYTGGKTNLADFKGKYVYVEVWATWCGPCIREMPELKTLIAEYKDKNIVFVSISVDEKKSYDKWKKVIADKKVGGVQLISDKELGSDFMKFYGVSLLPRSILLGPDGKLVNSTAPRPSSPETRPYLNNLLMPK